MPVTAKEEKEEKKVIDYYITDLNNKRIDKILAGDKILLNIHSKNMIDELFTIKLSNQLKNHHKKFPKEYYKLC